MSSARHRILYDPECRFCRWSLGWVLRWDRRCALEPVPLDGAEARRLLDPMPEAVRMASWHLVTPDGSVSSGGAAAAPLLWLLPGGGPLAAVTSRVPATVERAYACVVRNRTRLGRRLSDRSLERADDLIAARRPTERSSSVP